MFWLLFIWESNHMENKFDGTENKRHNGIILDDRRW